MNSPLLKSQNSGAFTDGEKKEVFAHVLSSKNTATKQSRNSDAHRKIGNAGCLMNESFDGDKSILWDKLLSNQVSLFAKAEIEFLATNPAWLAARSVADVGCGNGEYLVELQNAFPEKSYLGIDTSQMLIEKCLDRYGDHDISFYHCDIVEQTLNAKVDVIILRFVVQHLEDPCLFFQALRKISDAGTTIFIIEPSLQKSRSQPELVELSKVVDHYEQLCKSLDLPRSRIQDPAAMNALFSRDWEIINTTSLFSRHERANWDSEALLQVFIGWIDAFSAINSQDMTYTAARSEAANWVSQSGKQIEFSLCATMLNQTN